MSDKGKIPMMKIIGLFPNTILTLSTNFTFFLDIQPKSKKLTYYAHHSQLINTYFWSLQNIMNNSRKQHFVFVLKELKCRNEMVNKQIKNINNTIFEN